MKSKFTAWREKEREGMGREREIKTEGERREWQQLKARGSDKIKVYGMERKRKG